MKKVNIILLIFVVFVVATMFATWRFVESEKFSEIVTLELRKIINKNKNINVTFKKITFNVLPPGLSLHEVQFTYKEENEFTINSKVEKLTLFFDHFNPLSLRPKFKDVSTNGGYVKIENLKGENKKSEKFWDIIKLLEEESIRRYLAKVPFSIEKLGIQNLKIEFDQYEIILEKIKAVFGDRLKLNFKLKDFLISNEKIFTKSSGNISINNENIYLGQFKVSNAKTSLVSGLKVNLKEKKLSGKITGSLFPEEFKNEYVSSGQLKIKSTFDLNNETLSGRYNLEGKNMKSQYFQLREVESVGEIFSNHVLVKSFNAKENEGEINLERSVKVHYKISEIFPLLFFVKAKNYDFDSALYFMKDSLSPLQGRISGSLSLKVNSLDDIIVKNNKVLSVVGLGLKFEPASPLFLFKEIIFNDLMISYLDGRVALVFSADRDGRNMKGGGVISKRSVDFKINDFNFKFDDIFEKISDSKITGEGPISITVSGDTNESEILLDLNLRNASFIGFNLGNIKSQIEVNTKSGLVDIKKLDGKFNSSNLKMAGTFNSLNSDLNLDASLKNTDFKDLLKIHEQITSGVDLFKRPIWGVFDARYKISGKANLQELRADGEIGSLQSGVETESFKLLKIPFSFVDSKFRINNGLLKKNKTAINFNFTYDLNTKDSKIVSSINNGMLSEINYFAKFSSGLNSKFNFDLELNSKNGIYKKITSTLDLYESDIDSERVPNSVASFKFENGQSNLKVNLFKDEFILNLSGNDLENFYSHGNLKVDSYNLKHVLSTVYGKGKYSSSPSTLVSEVKWDFDFYKNKFENLEIFIERYNFFDQEKKQDNSCLKIINYKFVENNCKITAPGFVVTTKGEGDLLKNYYTDFYLKVEPSIFNGVMPELLDSNGNINVLTRWSNNFEGDRYVKIWGNDVYLNTSIVPVPFKSVNFEAELYRNILNIKKFNIDFNQGFMLAKGTVDFSDKITPYIQLEMKDVLVDINDKTSTILSAKASINGGDAPYLIEGQANLRKTFAYNEVDDFKGSSQKKYLIDPTYLPQISNKSFSDYFRWRIGIQLINPIVVSNSTYDIILGGDLKLVGLMSDPRLDGELTMAPGAGKTYFKNNEFTFTDAKFVFTENFDKYDPIIDAKAFSNISGYKINIHAQGRLSDLNMTMSSEPSLSESSILSLIAFGYTDNLSAGLSQADRSALSSVGVGAIFFEKLKVNSFLKESTGFQLNLGTDFAPDQKSMLSGANNRSEDLSGRFRSATKIELRRKLMDNLMLSVASTVGGSIGQKQSMNLNYNLNRIISLEGVYEVRTMEEGEENIVDTSIGGDLKWRWSFK